jgi:hypothetical protein
MSISLIISNKIKKLKVKKKLKIKQKNKKIKQENKEKLNIEKNIEEIIKETIEENIEEIKENEIPKRKIALIFWGLSRSLKYTLKSLQEKIFQVLKDNNFEYKTFFHTYFLKESYTNKRANEKNIKLDNQEYQLLNPDYFIYDWQEEEVKKLNISQYFPKIDPWFNNYETFRNYVLALNSQKKVTQLFLEKNKTENFDYVIYLRPDVKFLNKLDLSWFNLLTEKIILTPNFSQCGGLNDRFAIMKPKLTKFYGMRFNTLKDKEEINSEKRLLKIINNNNFLNLEINLKFQRIRANGNICEGDKNL